MMFSDVLYWNRMSYGAAIRIRRAALISCLIVFCLVTPLTNWLIPFAGRIFKHDILIRRNTR